MSYNSSMERLEDAATTIYWQLSGQVDRQCLTAGNTIANILDPANPALAKSWREYLKIFDVLKERAGDDIVNLSQAIFNYSVDSQENESKEQEVVEKSTEDVNKFVGELEQL